MVSNLGRGADSTGYLEVWLDRAAHVAHANVQLLTERKGQRGAAMKALLASVEDHFLGADILARMKFPRAAAVLDSRLPRGKRIRSGDLAEIIATEYVATHTEFTVPIKRLRHKDDREMSMRGDDIIGLHTANGTLAVLKAEVKSRETLQPSVVAAACTALEQHRGRPKPSTLGFIATQLRYTNRDAEAEQVERILDTRLGAKDIAHLVFTLSGNDPSPALGAHAAERRLIDDRRLIGLRVLDHQAFIHTVFESALTTQRDRTELPNVALTVESPGPSESAAAD